MKKGILALIVLIMSISSLGVSSYASVCFPLRPYERYDVTDEGCVKEDALSITNKKWVISLAKGHSKGTERTVSVEATLKFSGSVNSSLKSPISKEFGFGGSTKKTIKETETFSFDDWSTEKSNSVDIYAAIGYDKHKVTVKKYKVLCVQIGLVRVPSEKLLETKTVYVYRPKLVYFSKYKNRYK